jgi:protocatechuate 3,4-dioxygenase beta subunit
MENKNRRKFLRNLALTGLSIGGLSQLSHAKEDKIQACNPTTLDYYGEGPFYTANPPQIANNKLASSTEVGTKIIISGRVMNLDCSQVIPNTIVDVWQANNAGAYDNQGYNLRGKMTTNSQGFYIFETIKPGLYLNGASYRPSHIHAKVTPPGFSTLTTQIYFQGDPYIATDAAASISSGAFDATDRIITLTNNAGVLEGSWDIIINGNGIVNGVSDLHIDKGMVYSLSPNPCKKRVIIKYGVFKDSKISLSVFDIQGREVAVLDASNQTAGKYEVTWEPKNELANGHYFVVLKINALQVHYSKLVLAR